MELSQEILIETGLNVLGYIIVSIFSIMIYSMLKGKNKTIALNNNEPVVEESVAGEKEILKNYNAPEVANFISFGASPNAANDNIESVKTNSSRRDRTQIIRIARDMIKAGATEKNIMSVLPISEAELSILNMTK